ncbi:hypothetical protein ACN47E_000065 [Coniothyrium glycines]
MYALNILLAVAFVGSVIAAPVPNNNELVRKAPALESRGNFSLTRLYHDVLKRTPFIKAPLIEPDLAASLDAKRDSISDFDDDDRDLELDSVTSDELDRRGNRKIPGGNKTRGNRKIPGGNKKRGNRKIPGGNRKRGNRKIPGGN